MTQPQNPTANLKAQALTFLSTSLQDPHNPLHCGLCIDGAFIECTTNERIPRDKLSSKRELHVMKNCDPDVWNVIVGFMFHERTDEQMKNLLERMADCKCQIIEETGTIERYHEIAIRKLQAEEYSWRLTHNGDRHPAFKLFTAARCGWVLEIFASLSFVWTDIRVKTVAQASATTWPTSLADLFPFGPDIFVQTMLQWHRHIPDPIVFNIMSAAIRKCQMLVIPSLIKHQFSDTVIRSTREMVDRAMIDLSRLGDTATLRVSSYRYCWHAGCVAAYFVTANTPDSQVALLRGCETKAYQLYSIILYLYDKWKSEGAGDTYFRFDVVLWTSIGQRIFRLFHMHLSPPPSFPVHPRLYQMDEQVFISSWASQLPRNGSTLLTIRKFRCAQYCSAQGCTQSIQTAGRSFQRCGGCGVVSYCGHECQTNSWKFEDYPHRRVCSALRNLVEKGGGSSLLFSGDISSATNSKNRPIFKKILQNWKRETIDSDLMLIEDWAISVKESKGYPMPNGTEFTPGFGDYEEVIARLSANGGLKPVYHSINTARWPADVKRDKRLLKIQPFWGQEVDFH